MMHVSLELVKLIRSTMTDYACFISMVVSIDYACIAAV